MSRDLDGRANELRSKCLEVQILTLLNRAHYTLKHSHNLHKAWHTVQRALDLLRADSPKIFHPKCLMINGVIAHMEKEPEQAAMSFFEALPCLAVDPERGVLPYYLEHYQEMIRIIIRNSDHTPEERERDEIAMDEAVTWARNNPRNQSTSNTTSAAPSPLRMTRPESNPPFTPSALPTEPRSGRPFSKQSRPFSHETYTRSTMYYQLLGETKQDVLRSLKDVETPEVNPLEALEGTAALPTPPDNIDRYLATLRAPPKPAAPVVFAQDLAPPSNPTTPNEIDNFIESRKNHPASLKRPFEAVTQASEPESPSHAAPKYLAHSPPSPSTTGPHAPDQPDFSSSEPHNHTAPTSLHRDRRLSDGELALSDTPIPDPSSTMVTARSDPTSTHRKPSIAGRRRRETPTHFDFAKVSTNSRSGAHGKLNVVVQSGVNVAGAKQASEGTPGSPVVSSPLREASVPGDLEIGHGAKEKSETRGQEN